MLRMITRVGLALALAAAGVMINAAPAGAALSGTPDKTWMTNGIVYSEVESGNTIYIGGQFTRVSGCPPEVSCPSKTIDVLNVAALDATTGAPISAFRPHIEGTDAIVYALAVLGGKLFIGGQFAAVDGTPRRNLAAVDLVTGALDPNVDHQVGIDNSDRVRGMVATDTRVYAAGAFVEIDGQNRRHLAAFDADGALDPTWKPRTNGGGTHTVTKTCDGSAVIAGGGFREAAGSGGSRQERLGLAMFDAASGALNPWAPDSSALPPYAYPYDLVANCSRLFVGTGDRNKIFALSLTRNPGALLWILTTDGNAQAVALRGNRLLVGGHFQVVPDVSTGEDVPRLRFAVLDLNGNLQYDWVPSFGGHIHTGVWDILVAGPQIWVGGGFTDVSGVEQWGVARFTDVQ
jgi:hypothetical protein